MKLNRCSHLFVIKNILIILMLGTINIAHAQAPVRKPERQTTTQQKPKNKTTQQPKDRTSKPKTGNINGHDWIDLGLPSGTKWATCNVGANSPEQFGDYFAWGDIRPSHSIPRSSSLTDKDLIWLQNNNYVDKNGNLTFQHDAASQNWGASWHMPTEKEIKELINKCKWSFTKINNITGYNVTGPNGLSIFLPSSGTYNTEEASFINEFGMYWSSTVRDDMINGHELYFYPDRDCAYSGHTWRYFSHTIRPVCK